MTTVADQRGFLITPRMLAWTAGLCALAIALVASVWLLREPVSKAWAKMTAPAPVKSEAPVGPVKIQVSTEVELWSHGDGVIYRGHPVTRARRFSTGRIVYTDAEGVPSEDWFGEAKFAGTESEPKK